MAIFPTATSESARPPGRAGVSARSDRSWFLIVEAPEEAGPSLAPGGGSSVVAEEGIAAVAVFEFALGRDDRIEPTLVLFPGAGPFEFLVLDDVEVNRVLVQGDGGPIQVGLRVGLAVRVVVRGEGFDDRLDGGAGAG